MTANVSWPALTDEDLNNHSIFALHVCPSIEGKTQGK